MAAFLLLTILGAIWLLSYHIFNGTECDYFFAIVFLVVGSIGALVENLKLQKELKYLSSELKIIKKNYRNMLKIKKMENENNEQEDTK